MMNEQRRLDLRNLAAILISEIRRVTGLFVPVLGSFCMGMLWVWRALRSA